MAVGVAAIEGARGRRAAGPGQCRRRVADESALARKDGLMFSSASQPAGVIPSQPAAITSAKAVFPDPPRADDATGPGLRGMSGVVAQSASRILTCEMTCDGIAERRRLFADISAALLVDAGLAERIKLQCALDPREAIVDGLAHRTLVVGVAAVETGLAPVIPRAGPRSSRHAGQSRIRAAPGCSKR